MIVRIARLVVCEGCGFHATITFSDGTESRELFSEADALACILEAIVAQKMHPAEADHLRTEVRASSLPTETLEGAKEVISDLKESSAPAGVTSRYLN